MTVDETSLTEQRDPSGPDSPARAAIPAHGPGPGARARILSTSARLFYFEGIRAVGIDRLIAESAVTKATFYKHFGAKDSLILEYIDVVHAATVTILNDLAAESGSPLETLRAIVTKTKTEVQSDEFRGCAFANAAAEFPDPRHPVRERITVHRDWYGAFLAELLREAGHRLPGDAADELVLLRDGAMTGGYIGDPIATSMALVRFSERIFAEIP